MSRPKNSRQKSRTLFLGVLITLVGFFLGCSSPGPSVGVPPSRSEEKAKVAVLETVEDEKKAPLIQKEMNRLFFRGKKIHPGGLNAFSDERLEALEKEMKGSSSPSLAYFLENRKYFERIEDAGGGFRIVPNGKRLIPFKKTVTGRRKLFQMDMERVKEMIANPCFSAIEECGEYASDGEENTALLDEWVHKYPEKEFQNAREKVLKNYLETLRAYRRRKLAHPKSASLLLQNHIRSVETLLPGR